MIESKAVVGSFSMKPIAEGVAYASSVDVTVAKTVLVEVIVEIVVASILRA